MEWLFIGSIWLLIVVLLSEQKIARRQWKAGVDYGIKHYDVLSGNKYSETMETPKHFDRTHFRGITVGGRKFVYCPVGNICSWSEGDHKNSWCHWCKKYFSEIGA